MLMQSHSQHRQKTLDWREWLPVYGFFQARHNLRTDNPSIIRAEGSVAYYINIFYQGTVSIAAISGGIAFAGYLLDKII